MKIFIGLKDIKFNFFFKFQKENGRAKTRIVTSSGTCYHKCLLEKQLLRVVRGVSVFLLAHKLLSISNHSEIYV